MLNGISPVSRPAEWSGVAAAIALLIAHAYGVNNADTITDLAIVIGFVPAAVTSIVAYIRSLRKKNGNGVAK
jgi:hypothetical protein